MKKELLWLIARAACFVSGWLIIMYLAGCATELPKPLEPGEKVMTPYQCQELRKRGGEC